MKNNTAALNHPTMQRKIRDAVWLASLQVKATGKSAKQFYIQNRKGQNIMRVDMSANMELTVWGDCSKNITSLVQASLYINRR